MKISIDTIPHNAQRWDTVGDYWDDDNGTHIKISETGNEDYSFLIAVHELVEQYLCKKRGISEPNIMAFDMAFESRRQPGDTSEPGDSPDAPYRREHFLATTIERWLAGELKVDWKQYEERLNSL